MTNKIELKLRKNPFYLTIMQCIHTGLNPNKISEKYTVSLQRINHYLKKLKESGLIIKRGYGTWELTTEGIIITKNLRRTTSNRFEIRHVGMKFLIKHDNEIPVLKKVNLKNGVQIEQGNVCGCYVKKSKNTITIRSKDTDKGYDVWDAYTSALLKVWTCKRYIETQFSIKLETIETTVPEIIIKDERIRKVAHWIYNTFGRFKNETTEIDISKSKDPNNPDYELCSPEFAANVVNNLAKMRSDSNEKL